jgi:hypothetical protein
MVESPVSPNEGQDEGVLGPVLGASSVVDNGGSLGPRKTPKFGVERCGGCMGLEGVRGSLRTPSLRMTRPQSATIRRFRLGAGNLTSPAKYRVLLACGTVNNLLRLPSVALHFEIIRVQFRLE